MVLLWGVLCSYSLIGLGLELSEGSARLVVQHGFFIHICGALMLLLMTLGQSSHETVQSQRVGRIDPIFNVESHACTEGEGTGGNYGDRLP